MHKKYESDTHRINLRVSDAEFEELDDQRHAYRTTFQAVGLALFRAWVKHPGPQFHATFVSELLKLDPKARVPGAPVKRSPAKT